MSEDTKKVIYSMMNVSKFHGTKQVLKDIYISFYYGAKIGVLGLNGSGKTSLINSLYGFVPKTTGEFIFKNRTSFHHHTKSSFGEKRRKV